MSSENHDGKKPRTRSLALVLLAWVFIGGQALLAAGSIYGFRAAEKQGKQVEKTTVPWPLLSQGAVKMRVVANEARPEVIGNVAVFLGVANALGVAALMCGLLSWSRSRHLSGRLTIAAAVAIILVNSLLNLPYV